MGHKILVCGFCTEDRIDEKSYFGGAAGGIALNLSSFDSATGIISVLGSDPFSQKYANKLEAQNINTRLLDTSAKRLPKLEVISKENSERARVFDDFGCKTILANLEPDAALLNQYDYIHIVNTPKKLCDYIASVFTGTISYCPGSLVMRDRTELSTNLLMKTTYLLCNLPEYNLLERNESVHDLLGQPIQSILITRGGKGVKWVSSDFVRILSARLVTHVVDTTGAGDAFAVGFLKEILNEKPEEYAVAEGIRLASEIIQKNGVVLNE